MKKLVLFLSLLLVSATSMAQYGAKSSYYNSYAQAAYLADLVASNNELRMLNNIRFDSNAIRQNPAALSHYQDYLALNSEYLKKYKAYNTVGWIGLGVACVSLVPLLDTLSYEDNDPRYNTSLAWGFGLLGVGTISTLVAAVGTSIYTEKMKVSKKELIFYLKANHNGLGVVALF